MCNGAAGNSQFARKCGENIARIGKNDVKGGKQKQQVANMRNV